MLCYPTGAHAVHGSCWRVVLGQEESALRDPLCAAPAGAAACSAACSHQVRDTEPPVFLTRHHYDRTLHHNPPPGHVHCPRMPACCVCRSVCRNSSSLVGSMHMPTHSAYARLLHAGHLRLESECLGESCCPAAVAACCGCCSVLLQLHRVSRGEEAMLQAGSTAVLAAASYAVWQQCNPKSS